MIDLYQLICLKPITVVAEHLFGIGHKLLTKRFDSLREPYIIIM